MKTVEVENVGAVKRTSIPIPEEGGLVVLRGTQGTGKSTTLRAVDSILHGEGGLERRDGSVGGSISGFGVTLTVKKSTRRAGELEIETLDGKLSIAELVDPGIADPVAADAKRIKALVQLAGAKADPSIFYELVGGETEFLRIVGDVKDADLLKLSSVAKRKLQAAAFEVERSADQAAGSAKAYRESAAKVGDEQAVDPAKLQQDLEAAIREEATLSQAAKSADDVYAKAESARAALAKAEAEYQGPAVADAEKAREDAVQASNAAYSEVRRLECELRQAKEAESKALQDATRANDVLVGARAHFDAMAAWRQQIEASSSVEAPDETSLAAAGEKVADIRRTMDRQVLVRKAIEDRDAAAKADLEYQRLATRATGLREAAEKVDAVLSDIVGKLDCPLRVKDGRLVISSDRGEEYFSDLSQGERILVAVPIAAQSLPKDGVLTLPQHFYGEIAPKNRVLLHETLRQHGVVGITAEATDDVELTAGVFGG